MKKIISLILVFALSITIVGCESNKGPIPEGTIAACKTTEEDLTGQLQELVNAEFDAEDITVEHSVKFFDDYNSLMLALNYNRIACATVPEFIVDYLKHVDADFDSKYHVEDTTNNYEYGMLLMEDNKELCDKISEAIRVLSADEELGLLASIYIKDFDDSVSNSLTSDPEKETITVAITGDLPPMDYVNAEGIPCGFNVALLSKLSEMLGVNIETISINSASRATALTTGKCDVVFWADKNDVPDKTILTETYRTAKTVRLYNSKAWDYIEKLEAERLTK